MDKSFLIPIHKCKNCGACCGPIPINVNEYKKINDYVRKNKPAYHTYLSAELACKFRVKGKCSIYEVRPTLCRLMGVTKGMQCINGNTKELNGYGFMDMEAKLKGLLNNVVRTDYKEEV